MEKYLPKSHFIRKNQLVQSYLFLSNYSSNCETWGFFLNHLVNLYQKIEENTEMPQENRIKILSLIELEAMSKVMELSESLASLCFALTEHDKDVVQNMVDFNTRDFPNSDRMYKTLINERKEFYYKLLTYPEIKHLELNPYEKKFLNRIYFTNIRMIKKMFRIISEFRSINKRAYNKYRHSRTFFMGISTDHPLLNSLSSYYHRKGAKTPLSVFIHNKRIFSVYYRIGSFIINLQKDLIFSRKSFYEFGGEKMPVYKTYFEVSPSAGEIIERINEKIMKNYGRDSINMTLKVTVSARILNKKLKFYQNCPNESFNENDVYVEKYAKELSKS